MSKRIGVGVISLGWMGRLHARSYRALAERYQGLGGRGASPHRPPNAHPSKQIPN